MLSSIEKYPIRVYKETPYDVTQHPDPGGKEYGIIFSVFNRLDMTRVTLPSLVEEVKDVAEVIVVNDGSTDGTREWLSKISLVDQPKRPLPFRNHITVINCEKNLGIAASQNKALQLIKHRGYKYIVFHDNDVMMAPGWLRDLRAFLEKNEKAAVISPTFISEKQILQELGQKGLVGLQKEALGNTELKPHYTPTVNMMKAEVANDIGHFDERFTGFGSQCVDYVMRIYLAGWRAYTLRWVIGVHFAHTTVGIGFKVGWWNDEEMTNHNIKAFVEKWGERFNNSRPFLKWTGERVKELYGEDWINAPTK